MSFKSESGTVRAGLKAGSYKKADPDPYGFQGFAEQVTFGIRAEADARRKEDFLKKQEESAIRRERAKLQQAKETADLKMKGYINQAMSQIKSGFVGTPNSGISSLNPKILNAVNEQGITTYKGVLEFLEGSDNFQVMVNSFYTTPANTGNPVVKVPAISTPIVDTDGSGASVSSPLSAEVPTDATNKNLGDAVDQLEVESEYMFGSSSRATNLSDLTSLTWEAELEKLKASYELTPNKFKDYEGQVAEIRQFATDKGWVEYGGISTAAIRAMPSEELTSNIEQLKAGVGKAVSSEEIAILEGFALAKKEIEQSGEWWNKPEEIFTKLSKEADRAVVDAQMGYWKLVPDKRNSKMFENVANAISIFDHVQSGKPLDNAILEKMVGASEDVIEGLKAVYGDRANAKQKVTIEKLLSLAIEKDAKSRSAKDFAFTSWATRTGLEESLSSTNIETRQEAEENLAKWEKLWSARTSIAAKPRAWWEKPENLSKMTLEEVEILLNSNTITKENNAPAYAALLRLKPTLETNANTNQVEGLDGLDTIDKLNNYLALNVDSMETNPELQKKWTALFTEVLSQENAAKAEADIDPMELARRAYIKENGLDPTLMTFDEINTMVREIKGGTTVVDTSDPIIEGSDLFRLADGQYVRRTKSGKLRNTFTNAIVEVPANITTQPVSVEIQNQIDKQFTRLRDDLLTPMSDTQNKSLGTIRSAKRLSDLANANPEVLSPVGDVVAFLGRFNINLNVLNGYANNQMSPELVVKEVMGGLDADKLMGTAGAKALFDAEILKYAYLYASINLEQSGRGLSDNDFKQALRQVNAGMGGIEIFDKNIRKLTKETYNKVRGGIEAAFGSTETGKGANDEILRLETLIGKLSGFPRDMDQFVKFNRLQEETAWLKAESSSTIEPPPQTGNFLGDGLTLEGIDPSVLAKVNQNLQFLQTQLKENGEPKYSPEVILSVVGKGNQLSATQIKLIVEGGD